MKSSREELAELERIKQAADKLEAEKQEKKQKRLEKQQAKERARKASLMEKFVAPILLLITIGISLIVMFSTG